MEYQVPQFIEVEDKIFGPLTWKQFIFLAGGAGLSVIIFLYLPVFIALLLILPVMGFSLALSFYKVNDRSFIDVLNAGFTFYTKDRLYLWKKEEKSQQQAARDAAAAQAAIPVVPDRQKLGISNGRLHDLALSLDIQDKDKQDDSDL